MTELEKAGTLERKIVLRNYPRLSSSEEHSTTVDPVDGSVLSSRDLDVGTVELGEHSTKVKQKKRRSKKGGQAQGEIEGQGHANYQGSHDGKSYADVVTQTDPSLTSTNQQVNIGVSVDRSTQTDLPPDSTAPDMISLPSRPASVMIDTHGGSIQTDGRSGEPDDCASFASLIEELRRDNDFLVQDNRERKDKLERQEEALRKFEQLLHEATRANSKLLHDNREMHRYVLGFQGVESQLAESTRSIEM